MNGLGNLLDFSISNRYRKKHIKETRKIKRPGKARKTNINVFLSMGNIDILFCFVRTILIQPGIQSSKL
jgi:hypothetical protein